MTECERLVGEGFIQESFLSPEERCGFMISTLRKKIWAVELDLLREFDTVCARYGLSYSLMDGSMLGAVRHKGMIPWDDDIDVGMFRSDYEKLLTLGSEFTRPYFLQIPGQDDGYYYSFAKLRNSRTTCICRHFAYQKFNQGIFLDIFPIDYVDVQNYNSVYGEIRRLNIENSTFMRMSNPHLGCADKERVRNHSGVSPQDALSRINALARSSCETSAWCATATETVYTPERKVYPVSAFRKNVVVDFEMLSAPIPVGYDEIMRITYGNYLQLPPLEQRGGWHGYYDFDPDRPYVDVLRDDFGILGGA